MKVVINICFGGFGLSDEAMIKYAKLKGIELTTKESSLFTEFYSDPERTEFYYPDIARDDPDLIEVVASMGVKANGYYSKLKIVDVPDGTDWYIVEYDGNEHVAEVHKTWS